jgi:hypothetical protein
MGKGDQVVETLPAGLATWTVADVGAGYGVDDLGDGRGEALDDIAEAAVFVGTDSGDGFGGDHGSGSSTASPETWGLLP